MDEKQRKIWKLKQKKKKMKPNHIIWWIYICSEKKRVNRLCLTLLIMFHLLLYTIILVTNFINYVESSSIDWFDLIWVIRWMISEKNIINLDNSKTKQMIKSISDGSIIGYGNYHHHHRSIRFLISDFWFSKIWIFENRKKKISYNIPTTLLDLINDLKSLDYLIVDQQPHTTTWYTRKTFYPRHVDDNFVSINRQQHLQSETKFLLKQKKKRNLF